jgi:hypothetical protein
MAGASFRVEMEAEGLEEATAALQRLVRAGGDTEAAMRDIGEELLNSTRARVFPPRARG